MLTCLLHTAHCTEARSIAYLSRAKTPVQRLCCHAESVAVERSMQLPGLL